MNLLVSYVWLAHPNKIWTGVSTNYLIEINTGIKFIKTI